MVDELRRLLPLDKEILFVCIGTDRSTGDSLGPLVGMHLKGMGYEVLGTLEEPVHGNNLDKSLTTVKENFPEHFVVAVDACLGDMENIGKISVSGEPILPGTGVGKTLPPVGNISIKGTVNMRAPQFLSHQVLQSTRLSIVWRLSIDIANMCQSALLDNKLEEINKQVPKSLQIP